jgi:hypothetical protein
MTVSKNFFQTAPATWLLGLVNIFCVMGCGEPLDQENSSPNSFNEVESTTFGLSSMWGQHSSKQKRRSKLGSSEQAEELLPISRFEGDAEDEELEFVRETGFRPFVEDETDRELVRETGFMPTPRLTLVAINDGHAELRWTSAPNVAYYLLVGKINNDGVPQQHGTSFILRTTETSIDLDDDTWEFSVTAVGNDKARRSKASNRVQANPNAE